MINTLRIRNLATIKDLELVLDRGFTILTGETGAGKSIIIDGLKLVLGGKSSPDLIRTGQDELSVEVEFDSPAVSPPPAVKSLLAGSEGEILMQRRIKRRGSARGYIDGTLVPQSKLGEIGDVLVDVYGQNDHIFLKRTDYQRDYLDAFARAMDLRMNVEASCRALRKLDREKRRLTEQARERERRLDFLGYQINEIESAGLDPAEEEDLRRERDILKNMEKVRSLINEALVLTSESDDPLLGRLRRLQTITESLDAYTEDFKNISGAISDFEILLKDHEDALIRFREKYDESPETLDRLEERLSLIEKLKRKYGDSIEGILESLEKARTEFEELSTSSEKLSEIDRQMEELFRTYQAQCRELTDARTRAAGELEFVAKKEIAQLGMPKAVFRIELNTTAGDLDDPKTWSDTGSENIDFHISLNPGEDPKPLGSIASGGELSRIMLALKSIGRTDERNKTLIFDEIDTGIGGRAAEYVALKLKELSRSHQVICITHLPQIASFAEHHFRIEKSLRNDQTFTEVRALDFEERVKEVAQLLSGTRITPAALKNARDMLEFSAVKKKRPRAKEEKSS